MSVVWARRGVLALAGLWVVVLAICFGWRIGFALELYERIPVDLPDDLVEGDEVRFLSAGAYTSCYSTVGFNGFEPLPTVLV